MTTLTIEYRKQNPEEAWRYVRPESYPFEPVLAKDTPSFNGKGFESLLQLRFISLRAWHSYFKEAMRFSSLVLLTPGDTFW